MGKTIGVISLKGGVGKTSSVLALGSALSNLGKRVLLIDGNLSSPNLGIHLNILDTEKTINHVLSDLLNMKDSISDAGSFHVVPASMFGKFNLNPLKLKDKIKDVKRKYDVILVDSSPVMNDETLGVVLASDQLLVVTTPDHATLSNTINAIKHSNQRNTPISGLILNKVYNKNFEIGIEKIEDTAGVPVMAVIPHDIGFMKALSNFESIVEHKPNSEASEEYNKLAATLVGEKYKPIQLKSFFRWVNPRQQDVNRTIFYERVFS